MTLATIFLAHITPLEIVSLVSAFACGLASVVILRPLLRRAPFREAGCDEAESLGTDLKDHERRLILGALEEGRGSRKFASDKLGISPRTLRYKIARMREAGITIPGH